MRKMGSLSPLFCSRGPQEFKQFENACLRRDFLRLADLLGVLFANSEPAGGYTEFFSFLNDADYGILRFDLH
jgi:hypothetical protein